MVDRHARDGLAQLIEQFLGEEITSFKFDEGLLGFRACEDRAVRFAAEQMWYCYDDLKDHKVVLSKSEWDFAQRLLLLLRSDELIEVETVKRWNWTQLVALLALLPFLLVIDWMGFGNHLYIFAAPLGMVSMAISWWRGRSRRKEIDRYAAVVEPFASVGQLRAVYRSVGSFVKRRHAIPREREIRPAGESRAYALGGHILWLLLGPAVLLFQMLPVREKRARVVLPPDS